MVTQPSSNQSLFDPALSDLTLEAFARCQIRAAALTAEHMWQCRMSANLVLTRWANRVPNLWLVQQFSIPLLQGISTYQLPSNTVAVLDTFIRQYQLGNNVNLPVAFTTTLGSATVSIAWPGHGQVVGNWIAIIVPVAIGGIVLLGNYQVSNVLDANDLQIVAAANATASVIAGGVVPQFTTALGSSTVIVTLANHGLLAGQNFTVQVQTIVGNLTIGATVYAVASVISSSQFTITVPGIAASATSGFENAGKAQFESGIANVNPQDRVITPISRTDYNNQTDKFSQAYPSTYWFNRQINPLVTFWQVPDQNGPYVWYYYAMVQPQDAVMQGGTTMNMPYRFYDAFAAALARRLARKYAPLMVEALAAEEKEAWEEAADEDIERSPMFIQPQISGYYR